jgi:hypothetical protein
MIVHVEPRHTGHEVSLKSSKKKKKSAIIESEPEIEEEEQPQKKKPRKERKKAAPQPALEEDEDATVTLPELDDFPIASTSASPAEPSTSKGKRKKSLTAERESTSTDASTVSKKQKKAEARLRGKDKEVVQETPKEQAMSRQSSKDGARSRRSSKDRTAGPTLIVKEAKKGKAKVKKERIIQDLDTTDEEVDELASLNGDVAPEPPAVSYSRRVTSDRQQKPAHPVRVSPAPPAPSSPLPDLRPLKGTTEYELNYYAFSKSLPTAEDTLKRMVFDDLDGDVSKARQEMDSISSRSAQNRLAFLRAHPGVDDALKRKVFTDAHGYTRQAERLLEAAKLEAAQQPVATSTSQAGPSNSRQESKSTSDITVVPLGFKKGDPRATPTTLLGHNKPKFPLPVKAPVPKSHSPAPPSVPPSNRNAPAQGPREPVSSIFIPSAPRPPVPSNVLIPPSAGASMSKPAATPRNEPPSLAHTRIPTGPRLSESAGPSLSASIPTGPRAMAQSAPSRSPSLSSATPSAPKRPLTRGPHLREVYEREMASRPVMPAPEIGRRLPLRIAPDGPELSFQVHECLPGSQEVYLHMMP